MLVLKIPAFLVGVICLFIGGLAGLFPVVTQRINWMCLGFAFIALSYML